MCAEFSRHVDFRVYPAHYKYCMKSKLPDTESIVFNSKNKKTLDWADLKNNYRVVRKEAPKGLQLYEAACSGDSGAGQFVTNGINPLEVDENLDELRYVLVAIYVGRINGDFQSKGNTYEFPCGSYTWYDGEYTQESGESESTTWKENFDWIKRKITICETGRTGCTIS